MNTTVTVRETVSATGRRGIEVTFPDKPGKAVRTGLKTRGFRWNPARSVWWSYDSPTARQWAHDRALPIIPLDAPRVSVSNVAAAAAAVPAETPVNAGPDLRGYAPHSKVGQFIRQHDGDVQRMLDIFLAAADAAVKRGRKSMDNPLR